MTMNTTVNYKEIIKLALAEDLSPRGDITSEMMVPVDAQISGEIIAREAGVLAGSEAAQITLELCRDWIASLSARNDIQTNIHFEFKDGDRFNAGARVATLNGNARTLLAAERTMLNLLQRLSGIATKTRGLIDMIREYPVQLLDTRKTTPGLRALEKAAFIAGGGTAHRYNLSDMILIKENHLIFSKLDAERVTEARHISKRIECEVQNETELKEVLAAGVDVIMLDNFSPQRVREAITNLGAARNSVKLEASGGINEANIVDYANSGIDYISTSAVYTQVGNLDLTMLLSPLETPQP